MCGESRTSDLAKTGEDVDDTGWETSFFDELGGVESAERGLFGGLEDNDIAASDGRADLPCPHEEGEVPWDDLRTDTDLDRRLSVLGSHNESIEWTHRFLPGIIERLRVRLDDFAMDLICPAAVISQTSGAHTNIDLGHAERFAIVEGFNRRKKFEVFFE